MSVIKLPVLYDYEWTAKRDMRTLVSFQRAVDQELESIHGKPVSPAASEVFRIMREGDKFVIVFDDPSLP